MSALGLSWMGRSCGIDWASCTKDLGDSGSWDCRDNWTGVRFIGALCADSWLTGLLGPFRNFVTALEVSEACRDNFPKFLKIFCNF